MSVVARQSSIRCDCRVGRRPAAASLAFKGRATAVAFDVHLEDGGVMNLAVDDRDRIAWSGKILPHSPKGWLAAMRASAARSGR